MYPLHVYGFNCEGEESKKNAKFEKVWWSYLETLTKWKVGITVPTKSFYLYSHLRSGYYQTMWNGRTLDLWVILLSYLWRICMVEMAVTLESYERKITPGVSRQKDNVYNKDSSTLGHTIVLNVFWLPAKPWIFVKLCTKL